MLQLHGDEGPSFCGEAARRTGARIVKALQVSGLADIQDAARFHTDFHLLDARSTEPGHEQLRGGMTHRNYRAKYEKKTVLLNVYVMPDGRYEQFLVEETL